MGVDATLYIVAPYSDEEDAFSDLMVQLVRNYDLIDALEKLPTYGTVPRLQVMRGSNTADEEGNRVVAEDVEGGHLFGDSYYPKAGFKLRSVADLHTIPAQSHLNAGILKFIRECYPDRKFILFLH